MSKFVANLIIVLMRIAIILTALLFGLQSSGQITISDLTQGSQEQNVLRYDVSFSTNNPAHAYIEYYHLDSNEFGLTDTIRQHTILDDLSQDHFFTLRLLRPETTYSFQIVAYNTGSCYFSDWYSFATDSLPEFVAQTDSIYVAEGQDLQGYFLTNTVLLPDKTLQMFDRKGNVVWYDYHSGEPGLGLPSTCQMFNVTDDDHMILSECHSLEQRDLDGNTLAQIDLSGTIYDSLFFHHDAIINTAGNFVAVAASLTEIPSGDSTLQIIEEHLVEIDMAGEVIWSWSAFDYFDPSNAVPSNGFFIPLFGSNAINWMHLNSVMQDADNHYILSFKEWDQLIKINGETGDIIWRMNGDGADINFFPADTFGDQHDISRTPVGTYMVFDNTGLDSLSRILEFSIDFYDDPIAINLWDFVLPQENFSNILGSARRIPGGNRYCLSGNTGSIFEVNAGGEVLWHLRQSSWAYRAFLMNDLFQIELEEIVMGDNPDLLCINEGGITLTANPEGGNWSGDGVSDGTFSPSDAGIGIHLLTFKWGWLTETIQIEVTDQVPPCEVNLSELDRKLALNIYPIPSTGRFNVELNEQFENLEIFSAIGGLILSQGLDYSKSTVLELDLPSGSYFIRASAPNRSQSQWILIQ